MLLRCGLAASFSARMMTSGRQMVMMQSEVGYNVYRKRSVALVLNYCN
jgi:hypothetical protein